MSQLQGLGGSSGGSGTVAAGTINTIAKYTAATTVGNSSITDTGTTITLAPTGQTLFPSGTTTVPAISFTAHTGAGFSDSGGALLTLVNGATMATWGGNNINYSSLYYTSWNVDASFGRVAAAVVGPGGANLATLGWIGNNAGRSRVNGDVTNATAVMAAITGLTSTVISGRKYTGELVLKCSNSTAAEGIAIDFDSAGCTITDFAAGAQVTVGGVTVATNVVSTALATDFNWTTITGETWIVIKFGMTVNAGGVFAPRFCEGTAHTTGTATVSKNSYMWLEDTP